MSRSERSEDDIAVAEAIDPGEIPLIDFAPFLAGGPAQRRAVADEIARACRTIGFFYLKGHGVSEALSTAMFAQSAGFHGQDDAAKADAAAAPDWYRGWVPAPRGQALTRNTRLFDQYRLQLEWPADDRVGDSHGGIFEQPNRWPVGSPDFRAASQAYMEAMNRLSGELLRAFALGLELPEDRFADWFHRPLSQLNLLHYPPLPAHADIAVSNTVSHTDEGPFTILAQAVVPGLEVKRRDGTWIAAPPIPGAFTINIGDMMMWWSNGEFLSNWHRVKNRSGGARFSIPFFVNPDRDTIIAPLPEIVARTGPARYPPVRVSDHLARFYAKLRRDPHEEYR